MSPINAFKPLTKDAIADVLGISLRTIENWVNDGTLPAPKKLGNRVYWHPNAFYAWLDHRLTSNDETEVLADATSAPQAKLQKANPKTQVKAFRTEQDMLRAREHAKLEAMLA